MYYYIAFLVNNDTISRALRALEIDHCWPRKRYSIHPLFTPISSFSGQQWSNYRATM